MKKTKKIPKSEKKPEKIEKFAGENFSSEKYFNNSLDGLSFAFNQKKERLKDVKELIKNTENKNTVNYSQYIDVLLGNYEIFINIGKYVDRIDKNITQTISAQKEYSNLISSLRKDIEEFSFSFSKYLKNINDENNNTPLLNDTKNNNNVYKFEPVDEIELMEENFNFEEFLNPQEGSEKWLGEQIEKIKMLIGEKKYDECIKLILNIRQYDLSKIDYSLCVILDDAYNELIEKLTLAIGRCSTIKEVKIYLEKLKNLGCESLSVDTFLSWLSKKLRNRTLKKIIGEEDYDFLNMEDTSNNSISISNFSKSKSLKNSSTVKSKMIKKNENLNSIKEEEEEIKEEDENEDDNNEKNNNIEEDKNIIDTNEIINLINNKEHNVDKTIIDIINDYFDILKKSLEILNEYFNTKKNVTYSTYIIPWLRQEIFSMNKQLESLFGKIRTINELSSIMNFISELFNKMDTFGQSAKFIYDMYFIKNLNISLISIISYCLKVNITGVPFDLKYYSIPFNESQFSLYSVAELSPSIYNIGLIISEFINKYSSMKKNFIGIIFLEDYLFDKILNKEFLPFLKNKIEKSISNNYDLMPFTDNSESMAPSNQTIINYGITILSIEKFFYLIRSNNNTINTLSKNTLDNLDFFVQQIIEEKKNFFTNLLKVKIESHFFKFFVNQKENYCKNILQETKFTGPDKGFLQYFQLLKSICKMIRNRTNTKNAKKKDMSFVEYCIMDGLYINFLNAIKCLRNLNEVYETDFNLGQIGTNGIEHVIYGIYFVYFSCRTVFDLDNKAKFLTVSRAFIDQFVAMWSKMRNVSGDKFIQNKGNYEQKVQEYVNISKAQLSQGYS